MAVTACSNKGNSVQFVRYADDFICTASTKEILEQKVLPVIINFLNKRDLELSLEKTKITHIDEGFDFLGFNLRKYKGKLLIKPTGKGIHKFLEETRQTIKTMRSCKASDLINTLNPKIRGWANHYRHVVAKETFSYVDSQIFSALWRWAKRRHPNKNKFWIKTKYFTKIGSRNWCFHAPNTKDTSSSLTLLFASNTKITRYVKIKKDANPYDPEYQEYFQSRRSRRNISRWNKKNA